MAKNRFTYSKPLLSAHLAQAEINDIQQMVAQALKHKPSQIAIQWPEGYRPDFLMLQALETLAIKGIQIQLPEAQSPSELIGMCFKNTYSTKK